MRLAFSTFRALSENVKRNARNETHLYGAYKPAYKWFLYKLWKGGNETRLFLCLKGIEMMRIPYGFVACGKNLMVVSQFEAEIVNFIFDQYLLGHSLGGIAKLLEERKIASPTGNPTWGRAAIDKLLSNGRYVPHIVSFEKFTEVQFQKAARCNIDYDKAGLPRKKQRYCSRIALAQTQML